jgi:flagellar basal-body rod protein FlgG
MGADLFQILNISRQDMQQRVQDLDVVSNNLGNINTAGYKRNRANFQELLSGIGKDGTHLSATQILTAQGNLQNTGNPMDLAISGEGFFAVTLPNGTTGYTRDGQFKLDGNNRLVNANGYPLVWQGQIPAGATQTTVGKDGAVSALDGATGAWATVGTLQLTRFPNPSGLQNNGQNTLLASAASGAAQTAAPGTTGYGVISAGTIESGNVNLGDELTHMISLQRAFQLSTQAFQQTDEMISEAITMRKA